MKSLSNSVVAIILGGGAGSRLYPLTASRSKPAVPIAGKYRLVDIPISNCINANISRMFVLTQYNSASLNKHIKNTYHFSAFSTGFVDILAAEQTPDNQGWFQGTADAVRQSMHHINNNDYDYVLILSGDQLYQMDFIDMIHSHKENGADITIATIPVNADDAPELGIIKANSEKMITSFIEKPHPELLGKWESDTGEMMKSMGKNFLASMGIYIFNREMMDKLLYGDFPNAKDFGKEILPNAISNYKVFSYQYEGYWTDIGNIHSFYEANLALTQEIPMFNLFDNEKPVYTRARMLPPCKISGTRFDKVLFAEGCIIHAEIIENSIIGVRSRIGAGSKIMHSYVMGNDFYETFEEMNKYISNGIPRLGIGENCEITNTIIDKDCRIGNNVTIRGGNHLENVDHELYTIKSGIVVVKKGAVLPDGFKL
ncbi:MAG: glucose-1-phosphate adenylyltransferase [Bacteroidetes bacterium]|nr:glucose-1-phosphate adenylyltransferase [Bacteroidota bacterium]